LKPSPSWPSSALFGTSTSSKTTSPVSAARCPSLFFMRCFLIPGRSAGKTNAEIPAWRAFRSAVANTTYQCATVPFEMKCFVPLSTNESPTRRYVVDIPATSEPAPGSVMQNAAKENSPVS
jgi:hypothetical protein